MPQNQGEEKPPLADREGDLTMLAQIRNDSGLSDP